MDGIDWSFVIPFSIIGTVVFVIIVFLDDKVSYLRSRLEKLRRWEEIIDQNTGYLTRLKNTEATYILKLIKKDIKKLTKASGIEVHPVSTRIKKKRLARLYKKVNTIEEWN